MFSLLSLGPLDPFRLWSWVFPSRWRIDPAALVRTLLIKCPPTSPALKDSFVVRPFFPVFRLLVPTPPFQLGSAAVLKIAMSKDPPGLPLNSFSHFEPFCFPDDFFRSLMLLEESLF